MLLSSSRNLLLSSTLYSAGNVEAYPDFFVADSRLGTLGETAPVVARSTTRVEKTINRSERIVGRESQASKEIQAHIFWECPCPEACWIMIIACGPITKFTTRIAQCIWLTVPRELRPTDGNNRASFTAPIWRRVHRVLLGLETTMADNELDLHNGAVGPTKPGSAPRSGNLGRSEHEGAPSNTVPPASGAGQKGNVYIYIPNYKAPD
ncbi:hypothetical protein GQ600_21785 [Phytophthora cactorum]|nr:hypothetical protein GQ600_21785 [Phytophthora cactorum]